MPQKFKKQLYLLRKQQKSLLDKLQAYDGGSTLDIPDTSAESNNPDDSAEVEFMDEVALGRYKKFFLG